MPPRPTVVRITHITLALSFGLLTAVATWQPAAAAAPDYTMEERAYAIAAPSLVFLENRYTGVVRLASTGEAQHPQTISIAFRCTGFVVDGNSDAVTATHCIRPAVESIRNAAVSQLANERIKAGTMTTGQKDAFVRDQSPLMQFTGPTPGSEVAQRIMGQLFQATSNLTTEPAIEAQIVEAVPVSDGDVALLRFSLAGMPVAQLSDEPIDTALPVVMAAYQADSNATIYLSKSKTVRINGRFGTKTPVMYQVDDDLGNIASGGLVLDSSGRVIGMINQDTASKDRLNRLITGMETIKGLLGKAAVANVLTDADRNYREGLNNYFGGRYEDATKKLDSVISVMPDHALAKSYRKQAADRLAIEGDASSGLNWTLVSAGLGVTQVLSLIVIIVLLLRRRRVAPVGAPGLSLYAPMSSMPVSGPVSGSPISITPISGGPYETYHTFHEGPTRLNPDDFTTSVSDAETQRDPGNPGNPWAPR